MTKGDEAAGRKADFTQKVQRLARFNQLAFEIAWRFI
jgi:hypothetical protein